jgi:hypothetical protein
MPASQPDEILRINSEKAAIDALRGALEQRFEGETVKLDFDDWPTIRLKYTGEKFDGTITPDIAQAIVDVQEALNRTYTLAVYNTSSLRALPDDDRRALQIVASVDEGSSLVEINLGSWAEAFGTALVGKMTGTEIVLTVLGAAVVLSSAWAFKAHLKNRSAEKKLEMENEQRFALSQEETRRLEIVAKAGAASSVVREAQGFAESARDSLLRSAFDASALEIQGQLTITGDEARRTYRFKRREPLEVQLNGNYFIRSFTWADDFQSARVRVEREEDRRVFNADLSVLSLTADQKARFKDATFDNVRVHLGVNATVLDDQVTTAKIVSVDEQPPAR